MRKIIKIFAILFVFGISVLLSSYSTGWAFVEQITVGIFIFFTIIASLITLCATVFLKGNFKKRFLKGFPLSFILTGVAYILGYFYNTFLILWV
jgi:hypothetical protein